MNLVDESAFSFRTSNINISQGLTKRYGTDSRECIRRWSREKKKRQGGSEINRERKHYRHTHILSEGPPSLQIHVRPDIDIAKLMPRPITSPSVPRRVLGFVDEDEPCQRRTRVMNSVRELPPDISTVLGHHRYSERVPSDVYAVFREPRKCF